jgi:hypothetical protein
MPAPLHFVSEPREIAGNLWRVVVTDSRFGGRRFLYQFAPADELPIWADMQAWPTFDVALPRMGLPMAIALIYEENAVAIACAMREPESVAALLWA